MLSTQDLGAQITIVFGGDSAGIGLSANLDMLVIGEVDQNSCWR